MVIYAVLFSQTVPWEFVAEWLTAYAPERAYWCEGLFWVLENPSPKSQYQDEGAGNPALWSLKRTDVPGVPESGAAVKDTTGSE